MNSNIKTFVQACKALKIKTTLPDVTSWPEKMQKVMIAEYKLMIIAEALNEGWQPNWENENETKYYPYFRMDSGFSFDDCGDGCQFSGVGCRLCFKSSELAVYAGQQFEKLYKDYMTIRK